MGGYWIIINKEQTIEVKNTLFHKNWDDNTYKGAEAIILLELIEVIEKKGRHILSGKMTIGLDNRKVYQAIVKGIVKASLFSQDGEAEIARIRQLIKRIRFEIELKLIRGHSKETPSFR